MISWIVCFVVFFLVCGFLYYKAYVTKSLFIRGLAHLVFWLTTFVVLVALEIGNPEIDHDGIYISRDLAILAPIAAEALFFLFGRKTKNE